MKIKIDYMYTLQNKTKKLSKLTIDIFYQKFVTE